MARYFNYSTKLMLGAALLVAACLPYITPSLPVGSSEALEYRIVPLNAETMQQWSAPPSSAPTSLIDEAALHQMPAYDYELGAGDLISLIIYTFDAKGEQSAIRVFPEGLPIAGEDEFLVGADGVVSFPYVGAIQVQGKPFSDVKKLIERGLRDYFLVPQFQARVSRFAHGRVVVMGEVKTPKEQFLSHTPLTVSGAIDAAGGLLPSADLRAASITRANGSVEPLNLFALYYEGDSSANALLYAGDLLSIARNHGNQIFVAGEVLRPQTITMHPQGISLPEALQQAGGVQPISGDPSQLYVLRMVSPPNAAKAQLVIYHLNAANLEDLALADRFAMQPRDLIYVSLQPITAWDRLLSQFIPSGLSTVVGPQFGNL